MSKMKKACLEKDISELGLNEKVRKILEQKNLNQIKDIWNLKRQDLKKLGLNDSEIHQIIVKLQLFGIDLNKKLY